MAAVTRVGLIQPKPMMTRVCQTPPEKKIPKKIFGVQLFFQEKNFCGFGGFLSSWVFSLKPNPCHHGFWSGGQTAVSSRGFGQNQGKNSPCSFIKGSGPALYITKSNITRSPCPALVSPCPLPPDVPPPIRRSHPPDDFPHRQRHASLFVAAFRDASPPFGIFGCFCFGFAAASRSEKIEPASPGAKGRASSNLCRHDRARL